MFALSSAQTGRSWGLFGGVEFFRSISYLWEERWFLVELQVSLEVAVSLNFLAEFRTVFFRLVAESIVAGVSVVRCIL